MSEEAVHELIPFILPVCPLHLRKKDTAEGEGERGGVGGGGGGVREREREGEREEEKRGRVGRMRRGGRE